MLPFLLLSCLLVGYPERASAAKRGEAGVAPFFYPGPSEQLCFLFLAALLFSDFGMSFLGPHVESFLGADAINYAFSGLFPGYFLHRLLFEILTVRGLLQNPCFRTHRLLMI